jgi:hydrogenase/urease accessory protein HupE
MGEIPMKAVLAMSTLLALVVPAGAHPGHGYDGGTYSLTHHLSEPIHVAGILAVLGVVGGCVWLATRRQRPARS